MNTTSSVEHLKGYWPQEVTQAFDDGTPFFPLGSENYSRYIKILRDLEFAFNIKNFPKKEEKKLRRIILLHTLLKKSSTPLNYPSHTHFKKGQKDDVTFLSGKNSDLFALCKIYLSITEDQGTSHKKMRLAIKIDNLAFFLLFSLPKNAKEQTQDLLKNEIKVLNQLHPTEFILPIEYGTNFDGHLRYLCPFTELGTFAFFIEQFLWIPERDHYQEVKCIQCLREIILGLSHMHQQGLVHRDIKPDNILVFEDGAKLADFEYTINSEAYREKLKNDYRIHGSISLQGTIDYLAPEALIACAYLQESDLLDQTDSEEKNFPLMKQLKLNVFDYLSASSLDIWSLGVIFYEIAHKKFLIEDADKKIIPMIRWYETLDQESFEEWVFPHTFEDPFLNTLKQLARFALQIDPGKRPTIEMVLQKFEELTQLKD